MRFYILYGIKLWVSDCRFQKEFHFGFLSMISFDDSESVTELCDVMIVWWLHFNICRGCGLMQCGFVTFLYLFSWGKKKKKTFKRIYGTRRTLLDKALWLNLLVHTNTLYDWTGVVLFFLILIKEYPIIDNILVVIACIISKQIYSFTVGLYWKMDMDGDLLCLIG